MRDLKSFKDIWNKFMYILTPAQKRLGVLVFVVILVSSVLEMLGVSIILPLVQSMVNPKDIIDSRIIVIILDFLAIDSYRGLIIFMTVAVILIYIFKNIFLTFNLWLRTKFSMKVQREMSIKMIRSYNNRGYSFFRKTDYSIYSRGVGAAAVAVNSCISFFFKLLSEVLTVTCIFVYIAITDFWMVITLFCLALICVFMIVKFFRKQMQEAGRDSHKYTAINSQWVVQLYYGIKEIIVLNRKEYFVDNYEKSNINVQKTGIKLAIAQEIPAYAIEGICITGIMVAVCVRISSMSNPALYLPQLASFAVAAFRILPSLGRMSSNFNSLIFQIPFVNEAYENIKNADLLDEEYNLKKSDNNANNKAILDKYSGFLNELEIKDIRYKYPDGDEYVLDGIDISIKKGDAVAFVGPSGAGKSTLADVILGLLEPNSGSVLVDHLEIQTNRELYSKIVGYVPQNPYLIADTVRRNVGFGLYDYEIDDDKILYALEQAQLKDFILSLPEGLDTVVGERGIRFSGGQAQRLVIARALYNDPDILVLDEATSALDNETEKAVMESIDALQGHKTLIIIAHRLTTIKNCNHIYEIKDGKAKEKKYSELI